MSITIWTYLAYLALSIGLTIWVARSLHRMGRIFLVDAFHGREALADSINGLLVVGFYLINFGYVSLALRSGEPPRYLEESIRLLSQKVGLVLLVLGGMHFFNLFVFSQIRRRSEFERTPPRRERGREAGDALDGPPAPPPAVTPS
jgi:hypothetical protein